MNQLTPLKSKHRRQLASLGLSLGVALTQTAGFALRADDGTKLDKLEQENKELKKRLDTLESVAKAEGILPDDTKASAPLLTRIAGTKIEGFVTGSYFYDTSTPPGQVSPGYLWNRKSGNFSLNKVKLTLASPPAEHSGDNWSAGYRVSLMFGQDAPIVNSGSGIVGFSSIREAYVELNAPVGTGLNIKVGELISLLNYESGDGGAANDNFSQGYQWFYTGNGPAAGVQLGYSFTDWLDVKARVQNGLYAGPVDNNQAKTFMGRDRDQAVLLHLAELRRLDRSRRRSLQRDPRGFTARWMERHREIPPRHGTGLFLVRNPGRHGSGVVHRRFRVVQLQQHVRSRGTW